MTVKGNGLSHSDSQTPALEAAGFDFEPFGCLESMLAGLETIEIVSQADATAFVHADVIYSTTDGPMTDTDYVFLRLRGPTWKIDRWVPGTSRS